jgi:hypothetical protein
MGELRLPPDYHFMSTTALDPTDVFADYGLGDVAPNAAGAFVLFQSRLRPWRMSYFAGLFGQIADHFTKNPQNLRNVTGL